MTDTIELPFRQRVLIGEFNAIQVKDRAYVQIVQTHEQMFPSGSRFLWGHVTDIISREDGDPHGGVTRLVVVQTALGRWSFGNDGRSLAGLAILSIIAHGTGRILCLYEPVVPEERPIIHYGERPIIHYPTERSVCEHTQWFDQGAGPVCLFCKTPLTHDSLQSRTCRHEHQMESTDGVMVCMDCNATVGTV